MTEMCERCGKVSKEPHIINPSNYHDGFSGKTTILCNDCKKLWYVAFAIVNRGSDCVNNEKGTKEAWQKFMADGKVKVEFT